MRMRIAVAALVLVGCLSPARADEPRHATPRMAREEAEENAKTPVGRRYQSALDSSLDRWLRASIERCGKGVSKDQAISFNVYVQVEEKGRADDVLFDPETDVSRCVAPDFRDAKYPRRPRRLVGPDRSPAQIERRGFRRASKTSSRGPVIRGAGPSVRPVRPGPR